MSDFKLKPFTKDWYTELKAQATFELSFMENNHELRNRFEDLFKYIVKRREGAKNEN